MTALVPIVIAVLLLVGGGDPPRQDTAAASGPARACDLIRPDQARAALGKIFGRPKRWRTPTGDNSCTYYQPTGRATASVGLYRSRSYGEVVGFLPHLKRDRVLGRDAVYDRRLGYLIALPGRPYYMQVTLFHPRHTHADQKLSKQLAVQVLSGRATASARFLCSLTGEPI
jgi:hypothetical protein